VLLAFDSGIISVCDIFRLDLLFTNKFLPLWCDKGFVFCAIYNAPYICDSENCMYAIKLKVTALLESKCYRPKEPFLSLYVFFVIRNDS
jgi:hypothetical protein